MYGVLPYMGRQLVYYKGFIWCLRLVLCLNLLNILHQRILAVMQIEVYTNHVVDVGVALHLYVSGLAVHHRVAA